LIILFFKHILSERGGQREERERKEIEKDRPNRKTNRKRRGEEKDTGRKD